MKSPKLSFLLLTIGLATKAHAIEDYYYTCGHPKAGRECYHSSFGPTSFRGNLEVQSGQVTFRKMSAGEIVTVGPGIYKAKYTAEPYSPEKIEIGEDQNAIVRYLYADSSSPEGVFKIGPSYGGGINGSTELVMQPTAEKCTKTPARDYKHSRFGRDSWCEQGERASEAYWESGEWRHDCYGTHPAVLGKIQIVNKTMFKAPWTEFEASAGNVKIKFRGDMKVFDSEASDEECM